MTRPLGPDGARPPTTRWARWGFAGVTVTVATALVVITATTYSRVRSASELLERGLAETFVQALRDSTRASRGIPSSDELEELLEIHGDAGLTYVALRERSGGRIVEAGRSFEPRPSLSNLPPGMSVEHIGSRVRVTLAAPSPPPRSLRARRRSSARRGPRPVMLLEFEPRIANQLRRDGERALWLSGAASIVLLGAAALFWRLLRERERQQERYERERRLATLGEMSAVLAHEIRNPLASLKGHAQLLLEKLPAEGKEHRKALRIVSDAERLETLSGTLLDFVRSGGVSRKPVDPAEILRRSVSSLPAERIVMDLENAPKVWSLDPIRCEQVFSNLVQNALEASDDGQDVQVKMTENSGRLVVEVRDRGKGIPPGEEARIFDAFRTHRTHGTGLGLAVARRVVELHGGSITASNHPGGGALFVVEIPR